MKLERIIKAIIVLVAAGGFIAVVLSGLPRGQGKLYIVGGGLVCVIAWALIDMGFDRARIRRIADATARLGLTLEDPAEAPIIHAAERRQSSFAAHMWARGEFAGQSLDVMSFEFDIGKGKHSQTFHSLQVARPCPNGWPSLYLSPRPRFWRRSITKLVDKADFGLENERFTKRWTIECADAEFVLLLLSPIIQDWLMLAPRHERWAILGGRLCITHRRKCEARDVEKLIHRVDEFLAMQPEELAAFDSLASRE